MIDLDKKHLNTVIRILNEKAPDCEVRAFGSRVEGTAKKYSDLDLLLKGEDRLSWGEIESLKDAFSESDLPILVDVVDWHAIGDEFREIAEKRSEVLPGRGRGVASTE